MIVDPLNDGEPEAEDIISPGDDEVGDDDEDDEDEELVLPTPPPPPPTNTYVLEIPPSGIVPLSIPARNDNFISVSFRVSSYFCRVNQKF